MQTKLTVTYARDSSASLPQQHELYKIMSTDPVIKKRHVKSAEDFAKNLRILLGKAENRTSITHYDFCKALEEQC